MVNQVYRPADNCLHKRIPIGFGHGDSEMIIPLVIAI